MKKFLTLFFIGLTTLAYGQKFDIKDFSHKMEVAEWLIEYDEVAWVTSDSVMAQDEKELARLGSEWFCFEKDSIWHAVYGKYKDNQFDLVFHYKVSDGKVIRTSEAVDTSLLHRYSRALQTANSQIMAIRKAINLRFNQYIKENDDKTFTVWILPAFQPSGIAVYGGEFIYTIDKTGIKLLKDVAISKTSFVASK